MTMSEEHSYLYLGSASEARRYNELECWRASHRENIACKQAIEEAIRNGFDGMHLPSNCAESVIEQYGFKRVGWVLTNTIRQKDYDGRFSPANKAWAKQTFLPPDDHNVDFVVESHPAVLDGFINEFRREQQKLQLFEQTHCDSLMGQELEGKVLVMSPYILKESCWSPQNQLWLATGGFGCSPTASGRAVYATCLGDGEQTRWNREDFIGILREAYLPEWAKDKLQEISSPTEAPAMEQTM